MACSSRSLQAVLRHRWRCVSLSRSRGLRQGRLGFTHVHSVSPSLLCAAHMLRGSGTRRLATLSIPTLAAVRNVSVSTEIHLHPPTSLTHEGLSQVACPCCGKTLHLLDLRKHFSVHHQELDQEHCQHMCHERIQLYRRTIGTALKREPAGTSSPSSRPQSSPSWMLPTLSAEGYRCQMCVIRGGSFPTRDAFLKHVLLHHPTVDVDAMEPLVPFMPSPTSTTDSSEPIAYAAAQGPTIAPTRKLKNMERQTVEPFRVEVPVHLRGRGVSVPHSLRHVGAPPTTTLEDRKDGQPLEFSETRFPCELCRKVFGTELDLLNHLAMKHAPNVEAEPTRRASTPATLTGSGATPPPSQEVRPVKVMCDLCDSQKVFTSPSALFAHIRFKHPEKEAAHHVERLVDAHRQTSIAMCPHCSKGFASVLVLMEHIIRHHPTPPKADDQQPLLCIKSSPKVLGPITSKTQWWCNACERGYTSAPSLHRHLQARHQYPTQPRPCPACKRTLPDVYALVNHIAAQHPAIDVKELGLTAHCTCTHCSRSFLVPEQLLAHTRRHHHATESSTTGNAEEKGVPANSEPNSHDQPSRPRKVARPLRQS